MSTILDYLDDTYLFAGRSQILKIDRDETGQYLILDRTNFYPQGGGQPSDQGVMRSESHSIAIDRVRMMDGVVFHYTSVDEVPFHVGDIVTCEVNEDLRLKHAGAHTAGHLIAHCLESLESKLKATKGYHFLNGPYVEFQGEKIRSDQQLIADLNQLIQSEIDKKSELSTIVDPLETIETVHGGKVFRRVKIGDYPESPCGGTHLKNLGEFQQVTATKLKKTKDGFRISYDCNYSHH